MKTHHIEVTADDIERGRQHHPFACPVALAVNRTLNCKASVGPCNIRLLPGQARTPEKVLLFLQWFDVGYRVSPFSFELEVVEVTP